MRSISRPSSPSNAKTALTLIFHGFLIAACTPDPAPEAVLRPDPVYFSRNWPAGINLEKTLRGGIYRTKKGDLIGLFPYKNGLFQSVSKDNGRSWSPINLVHYNPEGPSYPLFLDGQFLGVTAEKRVANGGQIFFHKRSPAGWTEARPIRDTNWEDFTLPFFAMDKTGSLYALWTDWRNGNPDVYFSCSTDGGFTWQTNRRVDDDQTGQEQKASGIVATADDELLAFWQDNRSARTLFDIYVSISRDRGLTWTPGHKINDDTTHTFQIDPSQAVHENGHLYVVWVDYRDVGISGDVVSNVYFSRSEDSGRTWSKNVVISQARTGHSSRPLISIDQNGHLHCVWASTEDNLSKDIFYARSEDEGHRWTHSTRINDDADRARHEVNTAFLHADTNEKSIVAWWDWREGTQKIYFANIRDEPDSTRPTRETRVGTDNITNPPPLKFRRGVILFQDNFKSGHSSEWELLFGNWISKEGSYIGYGHPKATSLVGAESWQNYVFEGSFKLDSLDHRGASLYFRTLTDQSGFAKYYVFNNIFRQGTQLKYFDGKKLHLISEIPFPFQKDHWYRFRIAVMDQSVNYFIDDSLFIAINDMVGHSNGKIGVGSDSTPCYFTDVKVTGIY